MDAHSQPEALTDAGTAERDTRIKLCRIPALTGPGLRR